jgi:hypothetical protein
LRGLNHQGWRTICRKKRVYMYILYKGMRHEVHIDVRGIISNQLFVFLTYAMTPNLLCNVSGPALSNGEGKVGARRGRGSDKGR